MELNHFEHFAIDTARQAGAIIKRAQHQQKSISTKSSEIDLLTQYDEEVDAFIADRVHSEFPGHRIQSEEGFDDSPSDEGSGDGYVWHVDPIDGTINFVHGYPFVAVSIALYRHDLPLVSVIYDPSRDECFCAVAGQGAWLRSNGESRPMRVSAADRIVDSILATGFPYDRHTNSEDNVEQLRAYLKKARGLRRSGSAAMDLAYVAAGRLDGYWELRINSWDVAAGILLVNEAGGEVTLTTGEPLLLKKQVSIVASNGRIHQAMLDVLHSPPTASRK